MKNDTRKMKDIYYLCNIEQKSNSNSVLYETMKEIGIMKENRSPVALMKERFRTSKVCDEKVLIITKLEQVKEY